MRGERRRHRRIRHRLPPFSPSPSTGGCSRLRSPDSRVQPSPNSRVPTPAWAPGRGQFVDNPPTGLEKAVIPPGKGVKSALGLKEGGPLFGFTKANELFVGRLAQLGFVFSLIGEIITGKGALVQLNIETGVPIGEI